ncbi:MAG: membrane protein insertase YidC [Pseudanabaenaceae cyanobacterium SKYGB_i_bin29]|nr:membrane protein insertase YidC [Pseudanabaenaceae cyanobacterium SKYG29]MDW8421445.1 membrane protein insertase YidC [Pseudanabaenaceae cyanobacterium SKYGB_i_bin29]
MDFGVSFISNNIMLPILDFFYGIVPSYGFAIVALTLVVRLALFPVSADQLRTMRRMKIANPIMQQRIKAVQERYKNDPAKQQEELAKVNSQNIQEFGNPLAGCLPALLQMPILFALFATLRGSPFTDINYTINFQILPPTQAVEVQHQTFTTPPQNVFFAERNHRPVKALVTEGTKLAVGETTAIKLVTEDNHPFAELAKDMQLKWQVTKGADKVELSEQGVVKAVAPGEATVQITVPGIASQKGFLFIKALGKVGVTNSDGSINWDILAMVIGFGLSLYINQMITGGTQQEDDSQQTANRLTPIIFSGMFLFFPLPAGVLLYMLVANIFQTFQSYLVSREPLPENLQKLVAVSSPAGKATLDFEPKSKKKKQT